MNSLHRQEAPNPLLVYILAIQPDLTAFINPANEQHTDAAAFIVSTFGMFWHAHIRSYEIAGRLRDVTMQTGAQLHPEDKVAMQGLVKGLFAPKIAESNS